LSFIGKSGPVFAVSRWRPVPFICPNQTKGAAFFRVSSSRNYFETIPYAGVSPLACFQIADISRAGGRF
jgi:hypothetical protein